MSISNSSYSLDILRNLAKSACNKLAYTAHDDYLLTVQQGKINESHREQLHNWIFNVIIC